MRLAMAGLSTAQRIESLQMEHYVWLALTTIGAWFAAYYGAYFRKKGENLATHEDIDKLVDQVRAVTTTTKEIESQISGELWDRQKRWELKRDILFELVRTIPSAFDTLTSLTSFCKSEIEMTGKGATPRTAMMIEVSRAWMDAANKFDGATLLANLVCSPELSTKLFAISALMRNVGGKNISGKPEAFQTSLRDMLAQRQEIWLLLRKEMNIS